MKPPPPGNQAGPARRFPGSNFAWAASLFLAGFGAKLWLILKWGRPFPYLDQWPAEAIETFWPWFNGHFSPATLFQAHNEHRIVFTRLCELGLLQLNGQWDGLLEMAFNAVLHSAGIAAFGWLLASLLGKRSWPLIWLLLFADLAVPFAWENTLWGFQSHFYFLWIFSWLTIWLLGLSEPLSPRWWLGAGAAVAVLFTLATGFLAAAAVIAITGFAALKQPAGWRKNIPTWGFCAAIILLGLLLKAKVPEHQQFQAHTPLEFITALGKNLAWPWATHAWFAPLNLLPLLLLGWLCFRSPAPVKPSEQMIFGLAVWAMLQGLAGAFARGADGGAPAWRYMDFLSFITIASCLAIFVLLRDYRPRFKAPVFIYAGLAGWALAVVGGLCFLTYEAWTRFLPDVAGEQTAQLRSARAFLATDNPAVFEAEPPLNRPVPNIEADVWLLRNPVIRGLLPACARDALRVLPATNSGDAFVRNGWSLDAPEPATETGWGSWSAPAAAARGIFESQPIKPGRLPYLEIPVAGDLGDPGLSLQLVELSSGKVTEIRPPAAPHGTWVNVQVPAPASEFKLVAKDDSPTQWFAFKEPREFGRLSLWTLRLLSGWKYFLILGIGGFLLNLVRWHKV